MIPIIGQFWCQKKKTGKMSMESMVSMLRTPAAMIPIKDKLTKTLLMQTGIKAGKILVKLQIMPILQKGYIHRSALILQFHGILAPALT
jgi:hypothetical protein